MGPVSATGSDRFAGALRRIVGDAHVLDDASVTASYAVDWTGRWRGSTPLVVRPASTAEVAAVVAACAEHGMAVVPQGGNTGLVGGGVPLAGEVVLSLRRLSQVGPVDPVAAQVTVGAGATLAALQAAARDAGWAYGVDLAARDSATVGGTIATNAGGHRVVRYGDTRAQVLGVEAVLADGSVIAHLGGLLKDNTGYHLASLLCGSEGTLGVVTAARVRLVPRYDERVVALLGLPSVEAIVHAVSALRRAVPSLEAAETFLDDGLRLVCDVEDLPRPFEAAHAAYLLVECADHLDPTDQLAAAVDALDLGLGGDAAVAGPGDAGRQAALWRYREAHTEAINTLGPPHKLDVTVPLATLARFASDVPGCVPAGATVWLFGHVGDGNLHVNVTGVDPDDDDVDRAVLELVASHGGSISAEHGIGTAKRQFLHLARSPEEIETFRRIKHALDPANILNPNVLLP
ncbi:MAG: FAD-binding oxidoreductase [Acidimicrobiales bacterium]